MGVEIDEAGRDDQPAAVEDARLPGDGELADADDAIAANGEVALDARLAGAVVEGGAADDDVRLDRGVGAEQTHQDQRGEREHEVTPGSRLQLCTLRTRERSARW